MTFGATGSLVAQPAEPTPHTAAAPPPALPPAPAAAPSAAPPLEAAPPAPPRTRAPAVPARVRLSDEAELARIVSLYEAGRYAQCADELEALLREDGPRPLSDPNVVENARIYQAACLIGSGRSEQADVPLRAAILANPQMRPPDSLVFPPPVVERFLRVRETLYEEIRKAELSRVEQARREAEARARRERAEAERLAELEDLASREVVRTRNRRWIALIPFGVGQFQNGNPELGWVFLASEAVLGATALTALSMQTYITLEADRLRNEDNNSVLRTWNTLLDVSSYAFLAVAAIGILEAQLSFVPEVREERRREIPERLRRPVARIAPTIAFGRDSAFVGIGAKF
ncbi:MAG: hypothetical protein DIU78_004620 [Pseudomonadota bacterium]